ncbi:MAG: VanZ family protein [Actinobacteria bacterium]|nr:VanZ family protein [Actinomycetota bacterium]
MKFSRKQILGLLIVCGAVILHATMWPYNFRFDPGSVPARLLSATRLPISDGRLDDKKDIVLNVILFLPFGALLFLHRAKEIAASRSAPAFRCEATSFSAPSAAPTESFSTASRGSPSSVPSGTVSRTRRPP